MTEEKQGGTTPEPEAVASADRAPEDGATAVAVADEPATSTDDAAATTDTESAPAAEAAAPDEPAAAQDDPSPAAGHDSNP